MLGHEIGHVTARHAAQAYTRQAQAESRPDGPQHLRAEHGAVRRSRRHRPWRVVPEARSRGGARSRSARRRVRLGRRLRSGRRAAILATLARVDALSERGVPNWLSTHPDPGSRVDKAEPVAGKFVSADAKKINRDQYLERIHGPRVRRQPEGRHRARQRVPASAAALRREVSRRMGADQHAGGGAGAGAGHAALHGAAGSGATLRQGSAARRHRSATPRWRRCARPATPWSTARIAEDQRPRCARRPVSRQREGHAAR